MDEKVKESHAGTHQRKGKTNTHTKKKKVYEENNTRRSHGNIKGRQGR